MIGRFVQRADARVFHGVEQDIDNVPYPLRPSAFERVRAGCWAAVEWWDVHVRYRELHRRLDGVRADLVGLGLDSRGFAAYADALRTRVDPRLADDAPRMASEASDEDWCDMKASFEGLARDYAAFQAFRRGGLAQTEEAMRHPVRRVGTYNLLNGGGDRFPSQMALLRAMDLDLVALQEVQHGTRDDHALECAIANELDMQTMLAASASHGCHLVLAWNPARLRRVGYTADAAEGKFHHTLQRLEFVVPDTGAPLTVLHTHLDPFSGDDRESEARWLTEYAAPGRRTLLLGDLNTIGAFDPEPDWSTLPAHLQSRHRLCREDGTLGLTDRRAIRLLDRAGFIDPFADLQLGRNTVGHWDEKEDGIARRSDHILGSGLTFRTAGVIDDPAVRRLSDHLPAYAVVEV
ncbi:endonuclease/exonuclease/phosphatase family protein [Embleya sp. NBC_00888]|uniref:endonuclease/exonuclease/phosphatase family protein n=1 Tax=Embleya sp. NBC_00888 TaxID=2975960 RepID=UPI003870CDB4|nr:endonuclease/exonuclease/phosphatase family protein [Embleya sp. NBC_00888]